MNQANPIPAAPKPRKPRAKKPSAEAPPDTSQAAALSSETLLHVDLWGDKASDAVQPLAAQMVSDVILGTAGDLQSSTDTAISASYRSTRQAIAAVRNLCLLIDGFSSTGNTTIHAAFTLCYAGDLEHRDSSPNEPQRVLLIGAICDVARTIPGLRFRELPPSAKAPNCATLELLSPPHHQRAVTAPAPAALATPKPLEVSPQKPARLRVRTPSTPPQQSQPAPNPKRRMQIFAAAGAVALAAIIAFIFISRPPAKSQPALTPPSSAVAAVTPPAAASQPAPAPLVVATPKPAAEPHKQPPPPPKAKQPPPPQPEHETAPPPSSSGVTFSSEDIKKLIAKADKLSGDGNYDRAIALYDAVLRADRKNGAALEGRQRAVYNRDHR